MANETRKLEPVELSQLPIIDSPSGFWIFGSKKQTNGTLTSGRYLFDNLEEYARSLQLERRISLGMEGTTTEMFVGEVMTIYKVEGKNVAVLTAKVDGVEYKVALDQTVNIPLNGKKMIEFKISPLSVDLKTYLFIYAKAKV